MKKKTVLALAAGVLACGAAFAQGPFYAGVELGAATLKNQAQDLANTLVRINGGSSSVTQDTGLGFTRLFGGYNINKYVAAELGYVQSGYANTTFSGVSGSSVAYSGTAKLSVNGFDVSAIVHPMPDSGAKGLFFRAGMSSYTQKIDVSGINIRGGSSSKSGTGVNLGIGYDLPVGPGDVRFSYTNLSSVAGISSNDSNAFSVGYLWKF